MMYRDPSKIQGPADKHQLRQRQHVLNKASSVQPIDAVWHVVRYNKKGYTWSGPPYPSRIEFAEVEQSWDGDWLATAIVRAEALYADTGRIGELYRSKNFEPVACRKVVSEFSSLYPEFSDETIDRVISDGCVMAR